MTAANFQSAFAWTPERVARLTRSWNAGLPATAIAALLGCSGNAVIGKADRLGLDKRESPIGRTGPIAPRHATVATDNASAVARAEPRSAPKPRPQPQALPAANISPAPAWLKTCQWIEGRAARTDDCKCGRPTAPLRPYCAEHWTRSLPRRAAEEAA